tara:strand:- start:1364 stop:2281 length:918 start_codon:yes stop_codon:yes gene_type:complete
MSDFRTFIYESQPEPKLQVTLQSTDIESSTTRELFIEDLDRLLTLEKSISAFKLQCADPSIEKYLQNTLPLFAGKLTRESFYQLGYHWHKHKPSASFPLQKTQSDSRYRHHPLRPEKPAGEVYRRTDLDADLDISFRLLNINEDMPMFTRWMNDPRVAHFWEQAWSEEKLTEFAQERLADPHILPLIGEFNGQPFGYIEAYWVSEDRLSPYYDVQDFDRGIHLLVGEQNFRGPVFFNAWMRAISHYLFIDDNRTQRIVLEPRADNERLFNRILPMGYQKCFEFNFPHKRSALLMLQRDSFFKEQW